MSSAAVMIGALGQRKKIFMNVVCCSRDWRFRAKTENIYECRLLQS